MADKKIVELTTVPGRLNAEAILSYLQAFNVQGMISMGAIGSVYPVTVGELGAVQILIKEEDYEQAVKILSDFYQENSSAELLTDDVDLSELDGSESDVN